MMYISPIIKKIMFCAVMNGLLMPGDSQAMHFDYKQTYALLGAFVCGIGVCFIGQYLWQKASTKRHNNGFTGYYVVYNVSLYGVIDEKKVDKECGKIVFDATNERAYFDGCMLEGVKPFSIQCTKNKNNVFNIATIDYGYTDNTVIPRKDIAWFKGYIEFDLNNVSAKACVKIKDSATNTITSKFINLPVHTL